MTQPETKKLHNATVTRVEQLANGLFVIGFRPDGEFQSTPGQFVSILCDNLTFRRPFSVASFEDNEVGVLFKLKGKGTKYIASLKPSDKINFIGAMGNGFVIEPKKSLLVGAGVGAAPVVFLKNELQKRGIESVLALAFMSEQDVPKDLPYDVVSTNDGSVGLKGSILEHLEKLIIDNNIEKIYACGPHVVLEYTAKLAQRLGIDCEVAIEKVMACSIGVCRGCAIKLNIAGEIQNATVCKDGPVFKGEVVVW